MKSVTIAALLIFILASCNNPEQADHKANPTDSSSNKPKAKFTTSMVVNKIDLSCGMPLTAGIEDTCHYNGKVYGFCSKECKDDFLKNPAGAIKEK